MKCSLAPLVKPTNERLMDYKPLKLKQAACIAAVKLKTNPADSETDGDSGKE